MRYTVIIEKEPATDWGAYVPDLPGCVAIGKTHEEVELLIREAIELHLCDMRSNSGIEFYSDRCGSGSVMLYDGHGMLRVGVVYSSSSLPAIAEFGLLTF